MAHLDGGAYIRVFLSIRMTDVGYTRKDDVNYNIFP